MSLEAWREKLQRAVEVLNRNSPTYRHAKRFGLVRETGARVTFFFEDRDDSLKAAVAEARRVRQEIEGERM